MYRLFPEPFSYAEMQEFYEFCYRSKYTIGGTDRLGDKARPHQYLTSAYSEEDMDNMNFLPRIRDQKLVDLIGDREPLRSFVNLTIPQNVFFSHAHMGEDTLVYYANLDWEQEWAGETIIYEENGVDIQTCIPYKPGQVLWMEADSPHALRPPAACAPYYRFTFAIFFKSEPKQ